MRLTLSTLALALSLSSNVEAVYTLDVTSDDSIKSVASSLAYDMMSYYKGNLTGQIPGNLPGPPPNPQILNAGYFWWECGAMFGILLDYWKYTGDSTYNDIVMQGILHQTGTDNNFLPQNQTNGMGNDDQGFWALTAMSAAELGFANPPPSQPQWLSLVQAVYNTQLKKIDDTCGGGLRWQAYSVLNGYNYKNAIANGCFFNMATRLALYTGNQSYADTAITNWDWMQAIGLMDKDYNIYDGTSIDQNCTIINKQQFSYNAAIYLHGAATMYKFTNGSALWQDRVEQLLNATIRVFFPNGIAYEVACELQLVHCTIDMYSYKAYLTSWMSKSAILAPFIYDRVNAVIQSSAKAAVQQCDGSPADHPTGRMCGLSWSKLAAWDGSSGVGQQMAALAVVQSNLASKAQQPLSNGTGGTSVGDPNAGLNSDSGDPTNTRPATGGDKAGAGILTAIVISAVIGGLVWVSMPDAKVA